MSASPFAPLPRRPHALERGALEQLDDLYAAALAADAAGISVVPTTADGTKRPFGAWKAFQRQRPYRALLTRWFRDEGRRGIAFVTGPISGNLEMLEAESQDLYDAFNVLAESAGLLPLVETVVAGYCSGSPGGGVHLLYRCAEVSGNQKLARRPKTPEEMRDPDDRYQVLFETRGTGGVTVEPPSAGPVHPSGRPYVLLRGGVATIATITPEERRDLFRLARTFDELPPPPPREPRLLRPGGLGQRPGDHFNTAVDLRELLERHGWTWVYRRGETDHMRRPGKSDGVSATVNYSGSGLLYVFSSATAFEPERSYSPFAAYAVLEHNGNFADAARRLAAEGYGTRPLRIGAPSLRVRGLGGGPSPALRVREVGRG